MDKEFLKGVYGYSKIKEELYLIREWYLNPSNLGERRRLLPRGILLYGDPGQGKTHIVREYSKTFNRPVFVVEGNGDNLSDEVVQAFEAAKRETGIVVIDEIDRLIEKDEKLTRILMAQLDGYRSGNNVLTLATCNSYHEMPEALLREGRFDRHFLVEVSEDKDIEEMVRGFSRDAGIKLNEDDVSELAHSFFHYSPSEIRGAFNNAALRFGESASVENILDAALFLKTGFLKSNKEIVLSQHVAIHEAGHAIYVYKHSETMQFMRIYFDESTGYTVSKLVKEEDVSKRWIEGIQIALAGLVAEELILKKHGVGCEKDIEQAYRSSFRLLNRACIEDVRDFCENPFFPDNRVYSESRNRALDDKTLRFIHRNYQKVKRTLRKEKKTISLLASYLMENKGINREDFLRLLNGEM